MIQHAVLAMRDIRMRVSCHQSSVRSIAGAWLVGLSKSKISSIRIFGLDFNEYSVIRRIWAWLGHEKGVDP